MNIVIDYLPILMDHYYGVQIVFELEKNKAVELN